MPTFPVHTRTTAPEASRPLLDAAQQKFGTLPNLMGVLAAAPAALGSYLKVTDEFAGSSLTPVEQQVVLIATSVENGCEYCVSVHSAVAGMLKMPAETLDALRAGRDPEDARLGALARFTRQMVRERGWAAPDDLEGFLSAGFAEQQVLEVVVGVALKTISNYTNHIADTPLDGAFESQRWSAGAAA